MLTGAITGGPVFERITPSEVEQNDRSPVLADMGVPTITKSVHNFPLQPAARLNRNPDFVHQAPDVQLGFPKLASMIPPWSGV